MLGSPITDLVFRVFDPFNFTAGKEIDPIDRYLFNWNNSKADPKERFNIEPIRDTLSITRNGVTHKVNIPAQEAADANRRAGEAAREMLGNDWNTTQPSKEGVERIEDTVKHFQKIERDLLRAKYESQIPL